MSTNDDEIKIIYLMKSFIARPLWVEAVVRLPRYRPNEPHITNKVAEKLSHRKIIIMLFNIYILTR